MVSANSLPLTSCAVATHGVRLSYQQRGTEPEEQTVNMFDMTFNREGNTVTQRVHTDSVVAVRNLFRGNGWTVVSVKAAIR